MGPAAPATPAIRPSIAGSPPQPSSTPSPSPAHLRIAREIGAARQLAIRQGLHPIRVRRQQDPVVQKMRCAVTPFQALV